MLGLAWHHLQVLNSAKGAVKRVRHGYHILSASSEPTEYGIVFMLLEYCLVIQCLGGLEHGDRSREIRATLNGAFACTFKKDWRIEENTRLFKTRQDNKQES